jgi:hypothetical protein
MTDYQNKINEFNNELLDLIEKFKEQLPPYEISHALIVNGVSINLCCAPSGELLGMKTSLASVQSGIVNYEQTHS